MGDETSTTGGWEALPAIDRPGIFGPGGEPLEVRRFESTGGTGGAVGIEVHRFVGPEPGPRVVVLGGVHGDEVTGILAAGTLARVGLPLLKGSVEIVPTAHEVAVAASSRTSPLDGGNLARSFPGRPDGSPTERVAHLLATQVLTGVDLLIDLHTAGRVSDMPFLVGYRAGTVKGGISGRDCAAAFGPDVIWEHPDLAPGRTVSFVEDAGGVALYTESIGGECLDPGRVIAYVSGVLRVLSHLGMIDPTDFPEVMVRTPPKPRVLVGDGDVDAADLVAHHTGYFVSVLDAGDPVRAGELVGAVTDRYGSVLQRVEATSDGSIVLVRRTARVEVGDRLVVLAAASDHGIS